MFGRPDASFVIETNGGAADGHVTPIDDGLGRRAGMLLTRAGRTDAIDAAVTCLAADGDDILTSDPGDLRVLAEVADIHVELILI